MVDDIGRRAPAKVRDGAFILRQWPPPYRAPLLALLALAPIVLPHEALANCVTSGSTITCDATAPNPYTTTIGTGSTTASGTTVTLGTNAQILLGNANAISLGDNARITLTSGALVQNAATTTGGLYSTGGDTVEFRNNGTLTVSAGATIYSSGTEADAEAVNVEGSGNVIDNYGTIRADHAAAIWFQNVSGTNTVINEAGGVIQAGSTAANVIGASGNGAVDFTNKGSVIGSLIFAGGNDILHFYTGSSVTGSINGGAGNNLLTLNGTGTDSMTGALLNFQTLIKQDSGTWTLTGSVSNNGGTNPIAVEVQAGTLVLTGNNSAFNGTMLVDSGGTLSGRSTTLMSAITDNGLVQFNQTSNGTYAGVISGTGAVQKIGGGTLTLSPGNTYSGGTFIDVGTVSVGADSALGAATGGVTIDGGTLQFASAFDLATTRSVTIGSAGGTIDTNGNNTAIAQTIGGAGTLTKIGAGDLTLNGANTYAGGTNLNAGTITIGNNLALGPGALAMANGTTLSFVSGSNFSVANPISIAGTGNFTPPAGATDTLTGAISDGASAGALNMSGAGTLVLTAANTYSGGTTIGPGTLQLGDGGASGSIIGNVTDNGTLAFDRSDTMTFSGLISGTGGVNQIGSGTTVLDNNETYTGATDIIAGTLIVGDPGTPTAALSGGGLVTVDPGATLGGFGSIAGSVVNNGTLAVGNALSAYASAPMTNFIIGGDYSGSGTLMLNTVLNAGGALSNQSTDRLLIIGNASGTTSVLVNATGSGAYTSTNLPTNDTGISIIQVAGTASPNAFTLPGGYVSGGTPYQYHLNEYGPSSPYGAADPGQNLVGNTATYTDYRLQAVYVTPTGPVTPGTSTLPPDARLETAPQVPSYITAPTALFNAGFEDLDELHRRLGEIRDAQVNGQPQSVEIFVHGYGNTFNYTSNRSFADYGFNSNQNYAAAQMGGSGILIDNNAGTLRVGAAGSYGELWFNPMALDGQSNALFDSERLYGIATYQSRSGWYLDGIVAGGHFSGNVDTTTRGLAGKLGGTDVAASLEGGYLIPIGWENVFVEPEVQAVYQHLNFNGFTDVDGVIANLGSPNQGIVRAGGRLLRPIAVLDGRFVTPYVEVNLLQGFGDGSAINLSGANFATGQYGTAVQVRGGLSGMLSSNIAIFGDVAWQHQISDGGFRGWAFNAGLRHDF